MIEVTDLHKGFPLRNNWNQVISNASFVINKGESVAILGRNGAGKSTLMQLISGSLRPDRGQIRRVGTLSWPLGFSGHFHPKITGLQNVRFVARIYGQSQRKLIDYVESFCELGEYLHMPVQSYSSGMKAKLAFGVSMAMEFDYYLVDEITAVGDAKFEAESQQVFQNKLQSSGMIMISHSMETLRHHCSAGIVIENGQLECFADVESAIEKHLSNLSV
jgi:capsular polysaccharide transport system ATP-binding protein